MPTSDPPENWERVIGLARRHRYVEVADAMAELQDEWVEL